MSDIRAGFVGLGAMGQPMAGHLSRAGLLASVWTRTPANTRAIAAEFGIAEPGSLAELAESNGSAEVAEIFKNAMAAL